MCGIAGGLGESALEPVVERMAEALAHRGPDDAGTIAISCGDGSSAGAFAHRRLAVLDPTRAGHQPMTTPDGRYSIVYNGEIYNFRELREELSGEGVCFRSNTDTEVILHGMALHGSSFLERLNGMFALALWDRLAGCGYLARDRFGIKPLYLAESDGTVLFASEVRGLLASGTVPRLLSPNGVLSYLETGSVSEPWTIVDGVRMLPVGTVTIVKLRDGRARVGAPRPFATDPWGERPAVTSHDLETAASGVRQALRLSVERHLVSDVPVGILLSGGIDSAAVTAFAADAYGSDLNTFTLTFPDRPDPDAEAARAVARRFGTRHIERRLVASDFINALPHAFAAMDQPTQDGLNVFLVSRAIREQGLKVALSGLGGDEVFGGYPSFRRAPHAARLRRFPALARRGLAAALRRVVGGPRAEKLAVILAEADPARAAYLASRIFLDDDTIATLLAGRLPPRLSPAPGAAPAELSLLQRVRWYEGTGYMRNTLLRDADVFSMTHGLELRVPFVDAPLVSTAAGVEDRLMLTGGITKPLLVRATDHLLPSSVWDRPKQGFELPLDRWLRAELRDTVGAAFSRDTIGRTGLDPGAVRRLWDSFLRGRDGSAATRLWGLYTLVRWADQNDLELPATPIHSPAGTVTASRSILHPLPRVSAGADR